MAGKGGARPGCGRKKQEKLQKLGPVADLTAAARFLAIRKPPHNPPQTCPCEECQWYTLLMAPDMATRLRTRMYLTDKRDGKAVVTVNYLRDKSPDPAGTTITDIGKTLSQARKRLLHAAAVLDDSRPVIEGEVANPPD